MSERPCGARASDSLRRVVPHQRCQVHVVRRGHVIQWDIDGAPFLATDDEHRLTQREMFVGFSGWDARVRHANLAVRPSRDEDVR